MKDTIDANRRSKFPSSSLVVESDKNSEGVDDAKKMKTLEQRVAYLSNELEEERKRADERIVELMCKISQFEDSSKKAVELEKRNAELTCKLAHYEGVQQPVIQMQQNPSGHYLFLGADSVAESIAEELGVKKEELFIHPSGVLWVRAGKVLDDTRIMRETREFLVTNGVRLEAFSSPAAKLSNTVIMVKNLPLGIQKKELRKIFKNFGKLRKVLIPPEGAISGLVAFRRREDANEAFTKLHPELQLRAHPLYLEWAPEDVFEEEEEDEGEEAKCDAVNPSKKKRTRGEEKNDEGEEERKIKKIKEEIIVIDDFDESISEMPVVKSGRDGIADSSPTTPQCFLCDYRPTSVVDFYFHINKGYHKTNLCKEGYSIECECGHVINSIRTKKSHERRKCEGLVFSLRKGTGKKVEEEVRALTLRRPPCILCGARPLNWVTYLLHLRKKHTPVLYEHGYEIHCACGLTIDSNVEEKFFLDHKMNECKSRSFKVKKICME